MQAQMMQVPFSASWSREIIGDQDKFTPEMLLDELQEQNITVSLQQISMTWSSLLFTDDSPSLATIQRCILQVGMVIDLTNSSRYYSFDESAGTSEFQYPGKDPPSIFYRKVKPDCLDGQKHTAHTHLCHQYF